MNENFMKTKPVLPLVLSMALPMVLSMMVNSLYNIVDSYFVAQISGDAMTALSLVFPVQNFIGAVSIGFGIGINAVISIFLGVGRQEGADKAASQGVFLAAVHGVVMTVDAIAVIPGFLELFTESSEAAAAGGSALRIISAGFIVSTVSSHPPACGTRSGLRRSSLPSSPSMFIVNP